jgi:hypothetical protein
MTYNRSTRTYTRASSVSQLETAPRTPADAFEVLKNYPKPEDLSLNFTITQEGEQLASAGRWVV